MASSHEISFPPDNLEWVCPKTAQLELLFLSWKHRFFRSEPIIISPRAVWIYLVVQKGNPVFLLEGGRRLSLKPGDVLVVHPQCACNWVEGKGARAERLHWAWRNPSRCAELLPRSGEHVRLKIDAAVMRQAEKIHAACRHEVRNLDDKSNLVLEHLRLRLDVCLARSVQRNGSRVSSATRIDLALHWMKNHLSQRDPVASICDYLHVSRSTLHYIFLKHVGESPSVCFQRLKMEQAKRLLQERRLSVKEIAYNLGYHYCNDFSRAYKVFTGQRPRSHLLNQNTSQKYLKFR